MARRSGSGSAGAGSSSSGSRGSSSSGSSSGGSSSGGSSSGGSSSGGSSSGGSSSGGSSGRSSRGSSTTSTRATGGTPQAKSTTVTATQRQTRTPTTVSALAVTASKFTSTAKGRVNPRATSTVTVSPPQSQLTGGRIAQNPTTPQGRTTALLSGKGTPVTVTFAGGQRQSMSLSNEAIKTYQNLGLHVTPIQQTYGGDNPANILWDYTGATVTGNAKPQIPRIVNPSVASSANPPAQLHVNYNTAEKPSTRTNSNFGGLGANPWNPIESALDLFGMSPQTTPDSRWLPQQENNSQSLGYPTYEALIASQNARTGNGQTFTDKITGTNGQGVATVEQTIKNLLQNQYIIYAGLAIGALITIKIIMSMFGGSRGGGRGKTVIL